MPIDLSGGSIPAAYREIFDMFNLHGLNKLTFTIFVPLFESDTLTKPILNQIWNAVTKTNSIGSRYDLYKCLALMAFGQQGKPIDGKLLDNYVNRELPVPTIDSISYLQDRFVRLLRGDQEKSTLCFRYNDLCALDTIQVDLLPNKKGIILRHVEYEVTSMRRQSKVLRRYRDFLALNELLLLKYPSRIIPPFPPKKTINVDKEFIEERRRSLKRYLQILCRHPIIYDADIIKFFLTFQGTSCTDNMKATFKNVLDEFNSESQSSANSSNNNEKYEEDSEGIQMFHLSQTHVSLIHQYLNQIRECLKTINEKYSKNSEDFSNIGTSLQTLGSDSSTIDQWATGFNVYWPRIQIGLADLPVEMNVLSEKTNEQYKRDNEIIHDHLGMLVDLLQGYKDLCKRFEEILKNEQKAIQKAKNQQKRASNSSIDTSPKNDISLELMAKQNRHALKCVKMETQLVYANLEAFVHILNNLGNSQSRGLSHFVYIWKSFANKISQLGQNYINKTSIQRK